MAIRTILTICLTCLLAALPAALVNTACAEVTAEQRRELTSLKRDVSRVSSMLRRKQLDEAKGALDEAEEKVAAIATAAGVETTDRSLLGVPQLIEKMRGALDKQMARAEGRPASSGVSFKDDVAPILMDNCLSCHGSDNPRAGLRMDSFAGMKRGGRNGPLLTPGNANASLIMARLVAPDPQQRMPRNAQPLSRDDLQTLAAWIEQGARFDGKNEATALADLDRENAPPVKIPKPTGDETVSFTEDIAPWIANLCGNCHSANRRSGGLSLATFEDMMRGGDSGEVIIPGDREESRLFRLVGGLENPRMPQGQARITRQNYEDLKTWFDEGNTFDGQDPKTPLREYVRSGAAMQANRFAEMSDEEIEKHRTERTASQFKRTLPNDPYNTVDSPEFLVVGNVSESRLQEVLSWATAHADDLRKMFDIDQTPLWRGRLAIFVLKDHFGYGEFNLTINRRQAPQEMTGHSVVSEAYEDAYVVLQDVGDEVTADSPSLQINLIDHLTGAFLERGDGDLPSWLLRGTGLALASEAVRAPHYFNQMDDRAKDAVASLARPEALFGDGTFSPTTVGPVGYTLVQYILSSGGTPRFARLVGSLKQGQDMAASVRAVYGLDLAALARSYAAALQKAR